MNALTYRSPKTEVRESHIHGQGLFAKAPIARGEIVAVKGGHFVSKETWTGLEQELGSAGIQIAFVAMRAIAADEELTHD